MTKAEYTKHRLLDHSCDNCEYLSINISACTVGMEMEKTLNVIDTPDERFCDYWKLQKS